MTNEQLKQQAIQEAYGEYYKHWKSDINDNGELLTDLPIPNQMRQDLKLRSFSTVLHIPSLLIGIKDNNGWIRISEDGSNLPADEGKYFVYSTVDWHPFYRMDVFCGRLSNAVHHVTGKPIFTHYRPVVEHPKPVY